ncbi:reverse transcriptase domain-containing protein [Tanacetum coccineum]
MPSHVKTYNGSEDPDAHLKIFQAAAKTKRWAMPTWCHMFNSTLTGNARKKCIRDPIVLHNIKQRDGESTEDFIQRYKSESRNVKGAPECMRISEFVHEITNPELIKRFHEKIPKTVDEMMQVATSFLQGQEAASNQERKKFLVWRHPDWNHRLNFIKGRASAAKNKAEKDQTDECNHLRKQIEDMLKAGKLSHIIRELKQNSGKEQPKKKGETSRKEKPQAILMIQSRQNAISKNFSYGKTVITALNNYVKLELNNVFKLEMMNTQRQHGWISWWPRVSVKGQVLANFIVERLEKEGQDDSAKEEEPLPSSAYALRFQFEATNNEAEYEALIAGLRIAEKIIVQNLQVNVDSKLVANQVNGTYIAKETDMIKYLEKVKALTSTFWAFSIQQVPRSKNKKADALSKMASISFAHLSKQVLVEELKEKSVNESEVLAVVEEEGDSWMTPDS